MFFGRNNDIDDDNTFETKNNDKKKINVKLPLIILGSVILLIVAIFLINKLMNKEEIAYEERLYYINLLGDKEVTLYVGDEYIEPGYTGTDDTGNDLTNEVVTSNNIENDKVGNYKLSYTLGNITKERIVKVIEKPVGATYIYLYGDVNTFLYIGDTYQEKGYEVIDTFEGSKLKDKVIVNSNVDTSKEGIYKVIYSVVNSSGITVSKERTVIVTSKDISLLPNSTSVTNGNITINIYVKDELFDYLILPDNKKVTERIWAYEVSNNGTYIFTMYNTKGEKIEKKVIINNIDRESPSGSCTGSYGNGISQISIKANDNIGISKYVLNGTTYTTNSIRLNEELRSVNITIYDKAGNSKNISCNLENKNPPSQSNKPSSNPKPSSSKQEDISRILDNGTRYYNAKNKLTFNLYNQSDEPWGSKPLSYATPGTTLSDVGCGMTTSAVIASAIDPSITPLTVYNSPNNIKHNVPSVLVNALTKDKITCTKHGASSKNNIIDALKNGKVAAIQERRPSSGYMHYMSLLDISDDGRQIFVGNAYSYDSRNTHSEHKWYDTDDILKNAYEVYICNVNI